MTCALALVVTLSGFRYTGFDDPVAMETAADAAAWLTTQQQSDGSFEVAGFPGFETPDAVLALAENAQTTKKWNKKRARTALVAITQSGNSALHALDDFVDAGISAGQAAKIIVLVADPLGLSVKTFDPDDDGAVNLEALMVAGASPDGSYGAFNATLYGAIAHRAMGKKVPPATLAYIRAAQESDGGWDFLGDPTGDDADVDTTGLALEALAAAKVKRDDPDLREGLENLARNQQASGAWSSFGSDDPNSTARAVIAVTAAGFDPTASCWRDVVAPDLAATAYASPVAWLVAQQQVDGHIASPNDIFGLNTFATGQSVQALRRGALPVTVVKQKKNLCR
ncbi:MAG: hypothetical protein ACT4OX_11840 [Actinomycetota bacterium]